MELHDLLKYGSLISIGASGVLIIAGITLILQGKRKWHKRAMLGACLLALIFLGLYLTKSALFDPIKYSGGHLRFYLFVLVSHSILSALNIPLVIYTLYLAFRERFDTHRKVAPVTAAVWLYVAISGWMIYFLLK